MVNSLAQVVQQTGPFGLFDVDAQFCRHDTAQEGHLQRVLVDVLGVGGAVFEATDQLEDLGMDTVNPQVKGGLLTSLLDRLFHLFL